MFKITPGGTLSVQYSFDSTTRMPESGLTLSTDGAYARIVLFWTRARRVRWQKSKVGNEMTILSHVRDKLPGNESKSRRV